MTADRPDGALAREQVRQLLEAAVARLPQDFRTVFVLREIEGLSVEEVDALLGRPEAISHRQEGTLTVSTSLYRSRDRRITAEFVEGVLIRFSITSP